MKYKLKELLVEKGYIRGPFGSALKRGELLSEGIPVYEQQNVINNHRDFRFFINEEKYKNLKRFTVQPNDLLISCSGTVGKVSIIKNDDPIGIISQALLILRPNTTKVLPEFLYYFFSSSKGYNSIVSRSSGSVQVNIAKRDVIEEIEIEVPNLNIQRKIVNILKVLDSKVELNKKINNTLEQIAQSLFKHWFVDFEFPNENGKPYKSSGGKFVESELGMIPEGWDVQPINKLAQVNIGKTPPRKEKEWFSNNPNDVRWISIKDLGESETYILNTSEYLTSEAIERFNIKRIPNNTVVLSFKLTIGRIAITIGEMLSNEAIAHFLIKNNMLNTPYLYLYLKKFNFDTLGNTSSIATAINSKIVKSIPIMVPEMKIINEFYNIVEPLFNLIKEITVETQTLENLRDTLLPKLMSGEIRIPEAEEAVESCLQKNN
ncbi:restriction endonuclease subunit S [Ureibacillus sp. FSL W8-0352]|uniref:restriction endonuclease subunit S n=1 Tax=Ureibacillus sp. FSL W8-0352 TaxID=2954596 RepID=UPI0030FB750C